MPELHEVDFTARRRDQIVELLTQMLEDTRAGQYRSLVAVAETQEGDLSLFASGCDDLPTLVGKLFHMLMRTWQRMTTDNSESAEDGG